MIIIRMTRDIMIYICLTKVGSGKTADIMITYYKKILIVIKDTKNIMVFWYNFDYTGLLLVIIRSPINKIY